MDNSVKHFKLKEEIQVEIKYKQITDIVCVYNVKIYNHNTELQDIWRLCFVNELEQLELSPVEFAMQPDRELDQYFLFEKNIIEALRHEVDALYNSDFSIGKIQNKFEQYQFAMNNDTDSDNIIVAKRDMQNDLLYGLEYDIPFAHSIHFDCGAITNRDYDLSRALVTLKERNDIKLYTDSRGSSIFSSAPYMIDDDYELSQTLIALKPRKDIELHTDSKGYSTVSSTSYMIDDYEENQGEWFYIILEWFPSDEDWQRYWENKSFDEEDQYEYIIEEIFGLKDCHA